MFSNFINYYLHFFWDFDSLKSLPAEPNFTKCASRVTCVARCWRQRQWPSTRWNSTAGHATHASTDRKALDLARAPELWFATQANSLETLMSHSRKLDYFRSSSVNQYSLIGFNFVTQGISRILTISIAKMAGTRCHQEW